jgi:hypothetical protein
MNESLEEYKKEMEYKRRVNSQALAILGRAKTAGIPKKYTRIGPDRFAEILCEKFHGDTKKFTHSLYNNADQLFKKQFIIIDGGDLYSRKEAGFALLFRMIACDKIGKYVDCSQLASEFQSIRFEKGANRNDIVSELQKEEVLFINEVNKRKFNVHFDSGIFFDQLLEKRDDYNRPTILTFSSPLESSGGFSEGNAITDDRCGAYLALLSHADLKKSTNVFRIRVK